MGKVRDEAPVAKTTKPIARSTGGGWSSGWLGSFVGNLFRADTYKPAQGWYARLWTAIGLGLLVVTGIWRFYELRLNGTVLGVVLVHAAHGLVLAVWIASAAFAAVDAQLEEAARNLGAGPWRCFATVTLPLAAPGLIASAIFVFLESLDEFTGTYFVGVPDVTTLPLLMFNASMGGNYQIASITALLLLLPSIAFMLLVERFLKANVLAMVGR